MIAKSELETLSEMRLADALELFKSGRYSAAYYLSGYAVELGIKACIAKVFHANTIPDKAFVNAIYSHKLDELLGLAGLKKLLQDDMINDPDLSAAWASPANGMRPAGMRCGILSRRRVSSMRSVIKSMEYFNG